MTSYGQFCSVARAHEALGGRWTLLIVRELLCGSSRFGEIRQGIPDRSVGYRRRCSVMAAISAIIDR